MDLEFAFPWVVHFDQYGVRIKNANGDEVCSLALQGSSPIPKDIWLAQLIVLCMNTHAPNEISGYPVS
jgi:hypothetical protein